MLTAIPGQMLALTVPHALTLAAAALGRAETTPPAPLPPKTEPTGPTVMPPAGTGDMPRGVIRPPATVDPGITRGTPNAGNYPTPVVPPPGSPGGNPQVVPK